MPLLGSEDLVERWWDSPNKAFNKLCPSQVGLDEVYSYVLQQYK